MWKEFGFILIFLEEPNYGTPLDGGANICAPQRNTAQPCTKRSPEVGMCSIGSDGCSGLLWRRANQSI
jgi:hypothetical protein